MSVDKIMGKKAAKKQILTSKQAVKHSFAGQNIYIRGVKIYKRICLSCFENRALRYQKQIRL